MEFNPLTALLGNDNEVSEAVIEINGQRYIIAETDLQQLTTILQDLSAAAPIVKMVLPVLTDKRELESIYIINEGPRLNSKMIFENYGAITSPRRAREFREAYLQDQGMGSDEAIAQALQDVQAYTDIPLLDERETRDEV